MDEKQKFMQQLSKFKVLPEEEQLVLIRLIKQTGDSDAKKRLVESHLRIIYQTAHHFQTMEAELLELIDEGVIGLLRAVKHFDEDKQNKFISYAIWWIRQAMVFYINDKSKLMRMPGNIYDKHKEIEKAKELSLQEFNRLDYDFIAEKANVTLAELEEIEPRTIISLSKPFSDESDTDIEDLLPSEEENCLDVLVQKNASDLLLRKIDKKSRKIIKMYYGLDNGVPKTLEEIGVKLKLSKERVRQIKEKGMKLLIKASLKLKIKFFNDY